MRRMIVLLKMNFFFLLFPHSFAWTRNGTHFDVEKDSKVLMKPGSGTLVIDISGEKAEAYEGTYRCTAQNDHGTAVSNKIVIRQSSKTILKIQFLLFWTHDENDAAPFSVVNLTRRVPLVVKGEKWSYCGAEGGLAGVAVSTSSWSPPSCHLLDG